MSVESEENPDVWGVKGFVWECRRCCSLVTFRDILDSETICVCAAVSEFRCGFQVVCSFRFRKPILSAWILTSIDLHKVCVCVCVCVCECVCECVCFKRWKLFCQSAEVSLRPLCSSDHLLRISGGFVSHMHVVNLHLCILICNVMIHFLHVTPAQFIVPHPVIQRGADTKYMWTNKAWYKKTLPLKTGQIQKSVKSYLLSMSCFHCSNINLLQSETWHIWNHL